MIDTAKITQLIIDKATSGQLSVGFRPEDSVEDICKSLPVPSDKRRKLFDEACEYNDQYEIPEHWRWIKLGLISSYGDSPVKTMASNVDPGTWILELEDIQKGGKILQRNTVREKKSVGDKTVFKKGQILYGKLRPYLKKVLIADTDGISTPELISFDVFGGVMPQYLVYCLKNTYTDKVIEKRSYGIKMPRVDAGFMANLPIPVPPISEQMYIVDKVEKANAALDAIDRNQSKYQNDNLILKGKLIDAAIQGKLTEQLPEDGTAEELYQQIQQEKRKLEAEGKIKKTKSSRSSSDEERPFDIPEHWKWVSISDVSINIQYGSSKKSSADGKMAVLRMGNIQAGKINYDSLVYTSDDAEIVKYSLEKDDLLFNRTNSMELVGKTAIYKAEIPAIYAGYLVRITPLIMISDYLNYVMQSRYYFDYCSSVRIDANGQSNINAEKMKLFIFPLPPLAEQERIVAKLEELLSLCE
ncbi:MAG: restriction endonuclease subunit S [Clostridia bacterium]|nr:restriction endonuclease subunit S [Clostridia bacterium]